MIHYSSSLYLLHKLFHLSLHFLYFHIQFFDRGDLPCGCSQFLKKAIYGLKQSLRAGFTKFSGVVAKATFRPCNADHLVFVRQRSTGCVILTVYVNDILVTGSDSAGIEESKEFLKEYFVMKDLGKPKYFLGIEITHAKNGVALS